MLQPILISRQANQCETLIFALVGLIQRTGDLIYQFGNEFNEIRKNKIDFVQL